MFSVMNDFKYIGDELELFAAVHNWKSYWSRRIQPFVRGDVLEVGAGMGANTPYLERLSQGRLVCLEPDAQLFAHLKENFEHAANPSRHELICGTLKDLKADQTFDTILYIDVLEHIADDAEELTAAASRLRPGGRIVILSPAHQMLFTPFDAAIGHFRRYNRAMLRRITPASLSVESLFYLDSAGLLLSAANLLLLRQAMPTKKQLHVWDSLVIPVSRALDRCFLDAVGKSIVGVWQKEQG
jgi:SAM-dependent methyltransferase